MASRKDSFSFPFLRSSFGFSVNAPSTCITFTRGLPPSRLRDGPKTQKRGPAIRPTPVWAPVIL